MSLAAIAWASAAKAQLKVSHLTTFITAKRYSCNLQLSPVGIGQALQNVSWTAPLGLAHGHCEWYAAHLM
jgi:hypothetical protein